MERRKYTTEFKHQVVEQVLATGNISVVARKHNIGPNVISRWVKKQQSGEPMLGSNSKTKATHVTQQELSQLATEHRELDKENNQLKKLLGEKDLEIAILRDLYKLNWSLSS